jgi:hypothetical protein
MYANGKGVLKDDKQAVQDWIVLLHTPDQLLFDTNTQLVYNLLTHLCQKYTIAYAFGKGVLKDDKQAVYWYQKAADQGQAQTQFNLGIHNPKNRLSFCIPLIGCFLIPIHGLFIIF